VIEFRWGPVFSTVRASTRSEDEGLRRALTFRDPNYNYKPTAATHDGTYCYYGPQGVLTGLLPLAQDLAKFAYVDTVVVGRPETPAYPTVPPDLLAGIDMAEKYAFQRTLIAQVLAAERGLIEAPPRSGKSALMAGVTKMIGESALLLVGERNLMQQTYEAFVEFGLRGVGRLGDGHKDVGARTLIAMHQSAEAVLRRRDFEECRTVFGRGLLFVDEAHTFGAAAKWVEVVCACPARRRYGFSGTMFQERRKEHMLARFDPTDYALVGCFGLPIAKVPPEFLRDIGVLTKTYYYMLDVPVAKQPDSINWREIEPAGIVDCEPRNWMIARLVAGLVRDGRRPLALVRRVDHGEKILRMVRQLGVVTAFVSGEGTTTIDGHGDLRRAPGREVIDTFREGGMACLIGSSILDQAIDLPIADALIVGAGIKKPTRVAQRAYRPQTAKDGKKDALVFDFADRHQKVLRKHALARQKEYEAQGMLPGVVWPDRWLSVPTATVASTQSEWRTS
jgi:superfamily II DNA or RNA helicase